METNTQQSITEGKSTAIIAYITVIGLIIAFVQNSEKKNTFANFHIRQSLGLMCTGFALGLVNIIPILGWIVSVFGMIVLLILWISGLLNALNGKESPIPILGNLYNKWFSGIQ
ncbi:MAG: hypothetical protein K1X26_05165 [Chitinophagales bacterium]|nr:hypothetical protein [Chitinophagales bacterium]HMU98814.1 hypothetical protein [Chitinophagales bacterium]HMW95038.1 hypothetical protein [Chitinophagales bacterium]HMY43110.1 hypothetical protein [Chitinophagales bacterium]HMZ94002.1 hypothetical protein [Chitinophagales bacterium]